MVRVTIELLPGGFEKGKRTLGVIEIANDGTSADRRFGNYTAELSHAGMFFGKRKGPFKRAKVRGFLRSLSPYRLLCRILRAAKEE